MGTSKLLNEASQIIQMMNQSDQIKAASATVNFGVDR
jgi:hypothetical protein